jgi:hypothetical protein
MIIRSLNKYKILTLLIFILILIIVIILEGISSSKFHLVNTNPSNGSISVVSPSIELNFNKTIPSQSLSIDARFGIVSSYQIFNKTILLYLQTPTNLNTTYTIEIKSIHDNKNDVINNLSIQFVPKNIGFQDLPKYQQKQLLVSQQPNHQPTFSGTANLINIGITTNQLQQLQQYILLFNPKATNISFNTTNFSDSKTNTNNGTVFTIKYSIVIDNVSYNATSSYIGDNINLQLYNPQSGSLVYNSGNI